MCVCVVRHLRHVEGGALEGGFAEDEQRGGGVGRPRV